MSFFRLTGYQAFWSVYYKDKDVAKYYLGKFNGDSLIESWDNYEVEIRFKGELGNKEPDIIDFGGMVGIVFNSKAKDMLEDLIRSCGEFLPVVLSGDIFYIVNPTTVLDCIDYEKSIIEKKPPLNINKKYVFKENIDYPPIFRIKNEERNIIITHLIEQKLKKSNLIGYKLQNL